MTGHGWPPAVRADPWASLLEVPANEWTGGVADRPTRWRNTSVIEPSDVKSQAKGEIKSKVKTKPDVKAKPKAK